MWCVLLGMVFRCSSVSVCFCCDFSFECVLGFVLLSIVSVMWYRFLSSLFFYVFYIFGFVLWILVMVSR